MKTTREKLGLVAKPLPATLTYTVQEVSAILGIGLTGIYRAVHRNEIQHIKVGGSIRFPKHVIDRLVQPPTESEEE